MKAFFTRFSKAIGALGGGGIGAVIAWALHATGHSLTPETVGILPVLGSVVVTILAPPNSLAIGSAGGSSGIVDPFPTNTAADRGPGAAGGSSG